MCYTLFCVCVCTTGVCVEFVVQTQVVIDLQCTLVFETSNMDCKDSVDLVELVRCNALGEKQFELLARAEADSKVFDHSFRSQFEVKKEKWETGTVVLSSPKLGVHLGPKKKILKKKVC